MSNYNKEYREQGFGAIADRKSYAKHHAKKLAYAAEYYQLHRAEILADRKAKRDARKFSQETA